MPHLRCDIDATDCGSADRIFECSCIIDPSPINRQTDSVKSKDEKAMPRYQLVAQALREDLANGTYKVGSLLPTELEICKRFRVSRHTAREAVRRLGDAGLVSRRAGIGTTIKAKSVGTRYTASISDPAELMAFTRRTRLDLIAFDRREIKGRLAEMLPNAVGQHWPRFIVRRFVADVDDPIGYAEILVHPDFEAIRAQIHKPGATVYRLIEKMRGEPMAELRQEISCIAMPGKIASLLGTRPGAPALRVVRSYLDQEGKLLSIAVNTYPQDRFTLTTRWRLDGSLGP
jgi:DNA-binding GntR family transcriptional regulator